MADAPKASGFNAPGSWSWPEDIGTSLPRQRTTASSTNTPHTGERPPPPPPDTSPEDTGRTNGQPRERHWKPRTCRICLETVQPTYETPSASLPSYLAGAPNVTYTSEEGGRLIRPCKCKGSQRYVHEGCLQDWRHADPAYGARNFWQCPTCGFQYRLERMRWGRWITSALAQFLLTFVIFFTCIFVIGFIADPIIDFYIDPTGTVINGLSNDEDSRYNGLRWDDRNRRWVEDEPNGWADHFFKGFAGMGVLGFAKTMFAMGPLNWIRIGGGGLGGSGRAGSTGRDRAANLSWVVLIVGVTTFLFTVWKGVRVLSRRFLEKAGERVMDVPLAPGETEHDDDD